MDEVDSSVTWPDAYHPTTTAIVEYSVPLWKQTETPPSEVVARHALSQYNQCAWVLQATDDANRGDSVDADYEAFLVGGEVSGLTSADGGAVEKSIFTDLGIGDTDQAESYVENNCGDAPLETAS